MATLGDQVTSVQFKLGNRTDLAQIVAPATYSRIAGWLRDAYINLTMGNAFSELELTSTFPTIQGTASYPYPVDCRAIKALTLYRSDGTVITCETKDIKYIRRMNNVNQGAPSIWCDYHNSIIFRPVPDANGPYTVTLDYWQLPVVSSDIISTLILMPMDWIEALNYIASVRGHAELQEEDKSKAIISLLYGFTDPSGKYTPGLVGELATRRQATTPYVDWGVQPQGKTQSYTTR
jgi:hypothetical protein